MKSFIWLALVLFPAFPLYAETSFYFRKALDEYKAGQYAAALADSERALREKGNDWRVLEIKAFCLYQKGNTTQCLETCQESLEAYPTNRPLWAFVDNVESGDKPHEDESAPANQPELAELPSPPDLKNPPSDAKTKTASLTKGSRPEMSVASPETSLSAGAWIVLPISNSTANQFSTGMGLEGKVLYPVADQLFLGVDAGFANFQVSPTAVTSTGIAIPTRVQASGSLGYVPILLLGQFQTQKNNSGLYFIVGLGTAFNSINLSVSAMGSSGMITIKGSVTELDYLSVFGMGVAFQLAENLGGFVLMRMDLDFTSHNDDVGKFSASNGQKLTFTGQLTGDNPTVFFPMEAGLRF